MRLPVLIYDATMNPDHMVQSAQSFVDLNASEMGRFKLILYLYRPSQEFVDIIKQQFSHVTPYLTAGSKPPCIPCIWARHKTRYGLVIPSTYTSVRPIWPYITELRQMVHDIPNLTFIRLTPDNDPSDTPRVYSQYTRHIHTTQGVHLPPDCPVLTKARPPDHTPIISGALKPLVFSKSIGA